MKNNIIFKMKPIPEDQTKEVCKKLHMTLEDEELLGNHNTLCYYSRAIATGRYDGEKREPLMQLMKQYSELHDKVKKLGGLMKVIDYDFKGELE